MAKTKTALHGENKTAQLKALLTPKGKELLQEKANALQISMSELLELFARGQLDEQTRLQGEFYAAR